jgi:valyl-tRNA synthetase
MAKDVYKPKEAEPKWQKFWEENKVYSFDVDSTKKIFSIDTPPPTVSGKMHMGHAFGNSQQDFIARFRRMSGYNVLQPFGTDDNGLPTQLLIRKIKKVNPHAMGRKEFRKLCIDTLHNELKPRYTQDWKGLGISCDFDIAYSTIDTHSQRISQKSFLDLYKAGRQYRTKAPAMYCPKCRTAISQVELEDVEMASSFNDIVFKIDDTDLIIATTRPELLPACVAIFYHPSDERYKHLLGKQAKVPLMNFTVPIMEDERADPEKGTGIVMCCTFGDQTDMEWQKAHQLPIKEAFGKNGKMTAIAGKYEGLSITDTRKAIIEDLKEAGLLVNQKPITHAVNVHERCGTPIEFVNSKQWFVKYLDLKDDMLKWGEEVKWHPAHMKNRYDNWVKGLAWDWCISRQISFGIPFPVWYCDDCDHVIVAREEDLPVDPMEDKAPFDECPKCSSRNITGEKDIINTWATSSLTPTIVKELLKDTPAYEALIKNPMSLRPQGHDIISFWLFNTMVKSQLHFKMKPWDDCFINGWMLDPKGKKMSKSKGNIIEPQVMIDKYSSDALRFMAGGCKLGEDLAFPEKELLAGQRTIVKMYNAARFVFMQVEGFDRQSTPELQVMDKWVLSKLNRLIKDATAAFEVHDYNKPRLDTDKLFWQVFCDAYLEIVKDRIYNEHRVHTEAAQYGLYHALYTILKLFAPFVPHITEELYHKYYKEQKKHLSIHTAPWPAVNEELIDDNVERIGDFIIEVIRAARKFKSEQKVALNTPITARITGSLTAEEFATVKDDLKGTIKSESLTYVFDGALKESPVNHRSIFEIIQT